MKLNHVRWLRSAAQRTVLIAGAALVSSIMVGSPAGRAAPAAAPVNPCPRFAPGSPVVQSPDLFSRDGLLEVDLNYSTIVSVSDGFSAANALQLFCYTTPDGKESPTLHLWPGDRLVIHLKNAIPSGTLVLKPDGTINENQAPGTSNTVEDGMIIADPCLDAVEQAASTNIHFHGLNLAPECHQDDVMRTVVNPGHDFTYDIRIPKTQPPGLYWYHPHIHGINEGVVQGGASAAIVIEGIETLQPIAAGLPAQTIIVRDQPVPGYPTPVIGSEIPSWDLTVNYVTIRSCQDQLPCDASKFKGEFTSAVMQMKPGEKQLWRVLNAASHSAIDLQLTYDGVPQPLTIVALDGMPVNSQRGTQVGKPLTQTEIPMAPGVRAEFIVTAPSAAVKKAVLKTLRAPTGPGGDNHPERPLITIAAEPGAAEPPLKIPRTAALPQTESRPLPQDRDVTGQRKLFFSEVLQDPNNPLGPTNFYLTPDGMTPTLYDPNALPAITTKQGAVEDWMIENRAQEDHVFHIHQIHFLVLERNGLPVPPDQRQYVDMVNLPFWAGTGPYPTVKVRMDFRDASPGDLMYHCHYIFHADFGMMGMIRILPSGGTASKSPTHSSTIAKVAPHSMMHGMGHAQSCQYLVHGRCAENGGPLSSVRRASGEQPAP